MSRLFIPYVADCTIRGKSYSNLDILRLGTYTVDVRLPGGEIIKRNIKKHGVTVKYVSPLIGVKGDKDD